MSRSWGESDIPDLADRVVVVTGANSGLGCEAADLFAARGAQVVMACRNLEKAAVVQSDILARHPEASLETIELDLADLASVENAANECVRRHSQIDVLCNNAGVMAIPRRETADGFEMQIGTNHLGHFAFTGRLLPALLAAPAARMVNVSSSAHKIGRIDFDDLHARRTYSRWRAYAQSKLANLLFNYELQRRLERVGAPPLSVACHPGYAATNLQLVAPRMQESAFSERVMAWANRVFAQSARMGALPMLYAATAECVRGGDYFGPNRFAEMRGAPCKVQSSIRSHDAATAERLWHVSEELTGVRYDALAG